MPPRLRVVVSSPSSAYPPTDPLTVNAAEPTPLKTPHFDGTVSVYIKNYEGEKKGGDGDEYFSKRSNMTYAIILRGKFKSDVNGDEVMWGNVFEKPIRDSLPWGTAIATKFMYFVEPSVESDIYADKPYALSPMIASMNYVSFEQASQGVPVDEHVKLDGLEGGDGKARKKHFLDASRRKAVELKGKDVAMEFSNGLIDFNTLSISLPPPFSLQIPLTKYWDGQPVTYVCQKRGAPGENVLFAIAFEIVDEELKKALKSKKGEDDDSEEEGEDEDVDGEEVDSDGVD